jgi:hypothetical protein
MITRIRPRTLLGALVSAALLCGIAPAQTFCFHSGSTPIAAAWTPGPIALGCVGATTWPTWRQYVPAHRAPTPHFGYQPGRGEAVPVIVVRYRCTGMLLTPVVPSQYVTMGYVIDMPEHPCQ